MTDPIVFLRRGVAAEVRRIAEQARNISDQLWDDAAAIDKATSSEALREVLDTTTARLRDMAELGGQA